MAKRDRQTESDDVKLTESEDDKTIGAGEPDAGGDTPPADDSDPTPPPAPPVEEPVPALVVAEEPVAAPQSIVGDYITTEWGFAEVLAVTDDHMDVRILRTGTCKSVKVG